jgi:predicted ATPase
MLAAHDGRRVVITGGPGAGKTALLELARRILCPHVAVLPEAASVVYGGGFPRRALSESRRAAQRAIYHVQDELERDELEQHTAALILCDRGTIDGAAYWPGDAEEMWRDVGTTVAEELARYSAVIHLRTPDASEYNHRNPLRTESVDEARRLDARIAELWRDHPRRFTIDHNPDFLEKAQTAMRLICDELPLCCRI